MHAATTVKAEDRAGLERLCRYGLRASFALERLSLLPNGNVRYRLKRPWSDGRTEIVLSPLGFLRRLAALIPPKRIHTVRYHGVFSSASPLRSHLLPRFERKQEDAPPEADVAEPLSPCADIGQSSLANLDADVDLPIALTSLLSAPFIAAAADKTGATLGQDNEVLPLPLALCGRLLDEADLLPIRKRRLDWATLLRRVFRVDVLKCSRCDARLEVIAAISDPDIVRRILDHLRLPSTPPQCKPARGPPDDMPLFPN